MKRSRQALLDDTAGAFILSRNGAAPIVVIIGESALAPIRDLPSHSEHIGYAGSGMTQLKRLPSKTVTIYGRPAAPDRMRIP